MSSPALNQVYKTAIAATEEALLTSNAAIGDATVAVAGDSMTDTPFVVGQEYTIRDDQYLAGEPNAERILVTDVSSLTATPKADGIGYAVAGTIGVAGCTTNGFLGTLTKAYLMAANASVLTPGMEIAIQSAHFNCRFKTLADAPKIDFDDEASRFATGDEGRDQSTAGARSGEITFAQKLAWAGSAGTKPVWSKLMKAMGHIIRRNGKGTPVSGMYKADLGALLAAYHLSLNAYFSSSNGTDTTDGALATIKGSALVQGDSFQVTGTSPAAAVYVPCAGIEFIPHTWANEETMTIWIIAPENGANPASTVWRYRGSHGGNGSSIGASKIGDIYMFTGKFNGAYVGTIELSNVQARVLTAPEISIPEILINNTCTMPAVYGTSVVPSTYASLADLLTANNLIAGSRFYNADGSDTTDLAMVAKKGGVPAKGDSYNVIAGSDCTYVPSVKELEISQFSLDFGGVVNPFIDQLTSTGNAYYATQDRDPRFTCNPYHLTMSKDNIDFVVTNQICGPVKVTSGITNPHITISIPNAQLLSPAIASREGYMNTNRTYRALRNDLGAGKLDSTLPSGAMYSILIGSKS